MKNTFGPVAALLISASILLTGQGLQGTLLPVRASLESFPTVAIGIMGAAYFVGFTLGCLQGGELLRRVGHVRVFLAMSALASASPLIHALVVQPVAWAVLRLLTGFCFASSHGFHRSKPRTKGLDAEPREAAVDDALACFMTSLVELTRPLVNHFCALQQKATTADRNQI